jgi:hypothetical protein
VDIFRRIISEYEKTLYKDKVEDLKHKLEESTDEKIVLIKERDQALEDLSNVETAFSDVHR